MPITVVGRPSLFNGKAVLQILCNLKNFGVGRLIARGSFDKYPEPSYYKIVRVEPEMDEDNKLGKVWTDTVYRGRHIGVELLLPSNQEDFYLIHKENEVAHCNKPFVPQQELIFPAHGLLPPLLRTMIADTKKQKGMPVDEKDFQMKLVYVNKHFNRYRVAQEGETPNVKLSKHVSWNLYEDVMEAPKEKGDLITR